MTAATVLREKDLAEKLGVSRETCRKIRRADPGFPKRRVIYGNCEGWLSSEVDAWLKSRPVSERAY
jgi:predicted DNA-binding transcriptional regulator AlpA